MAIIGKIRSYSGLLITVVGVAMLAFILGDFITNPAALFSNRGNYIAIIGGDKIPYNQYEQLYQLNLDRYMAQARSTSLDSRTEDWIKTSTWEDMVESTIMTNEYSKLGMYVSLDELNDMVYGNNIDPVIVSNFQDPQTKQFDKQAVLNFIQNMESPDFPQEYKVIWAGLEQDLIKKRMKGKYDNLIANGLFISSIEAKHHFYEKQNKYNLTFIAKMFNVIDDSLVSFSEKDIETYYAKYKEERFKKEESRSVEYVSFEVIPSKDDTNALKRIMQEIKKEFTKTEEDSLLISLESEKNYQPVFINKSQLEGIDDSLVSVLNIGEVTEPYIENGSFKLFKLVDKQMRPDSVKARHILVKFEGRQQGEAKTLADSLMEVLKGGRPFAVLAKEFSEDGSSEKGGDLGWFGEGQMVPAFNKACFEGTLNTLSLVKSGYGYHIIQVTAMKSKVEKYLTGVIEKLITPGTDTYNMAYTKAAKFMNNASNNSTFNEAVVTHDLNKRIADNITKSSKNVIGLDESKELVKWSYQANEGDVSQKVFEFGSKFVVAHLTKVYDDGYLPIDDVRPQIEAEVKKEKKAQLLIDEFNTHTVNGIEELAEKLQLSVQEASDVNLASGYIQGIGKEMEVVGTLGTMDVGTMSDPVKGKNGVYVLYLVSRKDAPEITANAIDIERTVQSRGLKTRATGGAYQSLKDMAKVEDNRMAYPNL